MARIFVLEDDEQSREALKKMLCPLAADIEVDTAPGLADARLLLYGDYEYDLFLLDVNLEKEKDNDALGLVFAEEIRCMAKYEFTPLVMITSVAHLELEAYRKIHCYQYILKPYDEQEIRDMVGKVLFHIRGREKPHIIVKKNGINYKILCQDIVFCKAVPRGVCLYLKREQMEVSYLSVRQLLDKLPRPDFFQCHRMYVVNRAYVKYFDLVNQMIEVEGYQEKIDIGVTYKTELRRLMNE